ncbi:TAFII55 protein conserved region-domain-containing protein [Tricharina praecox]|uniref:TAFII55 protein conserved region-domain-containing protein n=1 Tax=Tricharina praecox TaxID=43433 RepID=UPI002220148F|nr:TAFII55 protein conserved region-domain-containing protein [Tricharina praecox]KAI5854041.1 TAFII55 protein conserved region-domain-containing protein [Tricharina praecox]
MVKLKIGAAALQAFHLAQQEQQQEVNPRSPAASATPSQQQQPRPPPPIETPTRPPKSSKQKSSVVKSSKKGRPSSKTTASEAGTPAPPRTKKAKTAAEPPQTPSYAAPPQSTPLPSVIPKIKIKGYTPAVATLPPPPPPPPSAVARPPKPKLKLTSSSVAAAQAAAGAPFPNVPFANGPARTPTIKLKHTPKPTTSRKRRHDPGNGYDSEASDREEDPAIEENFILRMQPGPDCDYLREVIERKELNVTSDVWMKFKEPRKAVVCVRGHLYAAALVDLPCVIEANKTLDKKNIFKVADICQMLLVTQRLTHEEEIWSVKLNHGEQQYPHGLTPPMQYARKRRFRKRISNRTIEAVEAEVDRLLKDDEVAENSKFHLVDAAELDREGSPESEAGDDYALLGEEEYDDEQDAEGEADVEYLYAPQDGDDVEMDEQSLVNDLESALFDAGDDDAAAGNESETSDEDEEEEVVPPEPELSDEAKEALQQREKLKEEIQDLEEMIASKATEYEKMGNAMLKARVGKVILGFQNQLDIKREMLAQLNA